MRINIRKWLRIFHRDLGYIFFGMTVIYGLSGIAVNHIDDWNPNYRIATQELKLAPMDKANLTKEKTLEILAQVNEKDNYKKHYFPDSTTLKIFIKSGSVTMDIATGEIYIEKLTRRPVFHLVNYLHYNPKKWWTLFSDIFAGTLIFFAISGLFMVRGKKGITGRGAWLTALGLIIPAIFLFLYY